MHCSSIGYCTAQAPPIIHCAIIASTAEISTDLVACLEEQHKYSYVLPLHNSAFTDLCGPHGQFEYFPSRLHCNEVLQTLCFVHLRALEIKLQYPPLALVEPPVSNTGCVISNIARKAGRSLEFIS
ncbi:hypothetical protein HETIRDRAFT_320943 [Heterobasidion irregulare TC 32-1]|uniref:Uncharacterized protein n=1 Tax=Heterobasidion irregulare (strain TC 32-1) TaxID=747525 RepID=W4K5A3_HETIT|nr:uncharacterized protein HETIRDRAFT_320943 [Heterobasidion irregulare TC 32-1]ETW80924.1 hypothetical protein HETIRDRAFT_320943 [Heterobasidion irregulare TC 32-1]